MPLRLDAFDADPPPRLLVDGSPSPEERVATDEGARRILAAIAKLPTAQRIVVYYRFVQGFSVGEVAELTGQPPGSVKSKSHYGLQKVRRSLPQSAGEGEFVSCQTAYAYLFQYANSRIMPADRALVERHLSQCESCKNLAQALGVLARRIEPAGTREVRHVLIAVPLETRRSLIYIGITFPVDDHERLNALLDEHGGRLPRESGWRSAAHDAGFEHIAEFDNEGHRIEFELEPDPDEPRNVVVQYLKMTKVYAQHTMMSVGFGGHSSISSSPEASNLMLGRMNNLLGTAAKSGLYLALPGAAENVRIRRGNGVIDAGAFKFAYAERYVADDETIRLDCTYLNR